MIADHGQTHVKEIAKLQPRFAHEQATLVTSSNRAAAIYRLDDTAPSARALAERLDGEASVEVVAFAEDGASSRPA